MTKITWKDPTSLPLVASGVMFAPSTGGSSRYSVTARREVILAAGAIQTPALMQLSGIGDSNVLNAVGVRTLIDLKTVGRNLQEQVCIFVGLFSGWSLMYLQTMNSLGANSNGFNPGGRGPSDAIAFPNIYQVFGSQANSQISTMRSSLSSWAASQANNALSASALQEIFQIQANLIVNNSGRFYIATPNRCLMSFLAPIVELFYDTGFPA